MKLLPACHTDRIQVLSKSIAYLCSVMPELMIIVESFVNSFSSEHIRISIELCLQPPVKYVTDVVTGNLVACGECQGEEDDHDGDDEVTNQDFVADGENFVTLGELPGLVKTD